MDNPYDQGFRAGYLGGPKLPPAGKHEREKFTAKGAVMGVYRQVEMPWLPGGYRVR